MKRFALPVMLAATAAALAQPAQAQQVGSVPAIEAGHTLLTVTADGKGQITAVKIDPGVVNPDDVEMLEDLVMVAVRDAQKKAGDLAKSEMGKLTGGMDLPFKLPF